MILPVESLDIELQPVAEEAVLQPQCVGRDRLRPIGRVVVEAAGAVSRLDTGIGQGPWPDVGLDSPTVRDLVGRRISARDRIGATDQDAWRAHEGRAARGRYER